MIKKSGITPHATLGVACATCVHFKRVALFNKPCYELGVSDYALAPRCYVPDVHQLVDKVDTTLISNLGRVCAQLDADMVRLLAFTLSHVADLQDSKFKFGQPVYFSLGIDVVSHYFKGCLVSIKDDVATVSACLHGAKSTTTIVLPITSLLTKSEWRQKVSDLVDANAVFTSNLPQGKKHFADWVTHEGKLDKDAVAIKRQVLADELYEPPTIDMCDDDLLARYRQQTEKKRKGKGRPKKLGNLNVEKGEGADVFTMEQDTGFGGGADE